MLRSTILRGAVLLALALCAAPQRAAAIFHLWDVVEVYSNADGSVQYVELFTTAAGQGVLGAHTLTATSDGVVRTFTFPSGVASTTANKHLLIATPGFAKLPGAVTPDFVLPCGPFFEPDAASITINFADADTMVFGSASLPLDGTLALVDGNSGGVPSLSTATNAPTNFAGSTGQLALTACLIAGSCEPCDDGLFCNGVETCAGSACVATPCTQLCNEETDVCAECFGAGDCDDGEVCTADACDAGVCVHDAAPGNCDDGQFCTTFDMCAGGTCAGGNMTPCGGENCNEDGDYCGDCQLASDCEDGDPCTTHACNGGRCETGEADDGTPCADDGFFCDGPEACSAGTCQSAGDPCDPESQTCDEEQATCVPEAGGTVSAVVAALLVAALRARRSGLGTLARAPR